MSSSLAPRPAGGNTVEADGVVVDLRNRYVAAVLAWLIPGAGHYYQRRYVKSAIFFFAIMSTFGLGMLVANGRCVYASWNDVDKRWQYVLQAGIGLPAMPAAYQSYRQHHRMQPAFGGFMAPPRFQGDLATWNRETASGFDMGTLYTMIAGLLNVLVIFDAFGGPLPPPEKPVKKGKSDSDKNKTNDSSQSTPTTTTS